MSKTFTLEYLGTEHNIGDSRCSACWKDDIEQCECGGLVHSGFGDEMEDGYYLIYGCDKCGSDYVLREEVV